VSARSHLPATVETGDEEGGPGGDDAADASPEIERLVAKILAEMDFDCTIDVQAEAEVYMAMVGGADKELLLEGNGRPLSALELILNHAFRHRLTERRKIRVDAGDFRSRREDELRDLAFQVAHSAKETESTQETQPLNPYERRLVHLALAEDTGVTTRSRGSGFLKNGEVIPRRSGRGNR
jgi:predicted RNA-binding protein Jag